MYNAGIKKTVPIRFPHTPHHKIRPQAIATSIPGPLRRLPHHRLPAAVVPGRPAELPHDIPKLVVAPSYETPLQAHESMVSGEALATSIALLRQPLKVPPVLEV
ncbi:unnamed protein product, partial [Heterosigma akashiwo]